jgi:hypothetical protein
MVIIRRAAPTDINATAATRVELAPLDGAVGGVGADPAGLTASMVP